MEGGGEIPPPSYKAEWTMILFGICLRKDRMGVSLAIGIRRWEKILYLKKYPKPKYSKTPEMADPEMLTEVPKGKIFEPEDMDIDTPPIKLIDPEDM